MSVELYEAIARSAQLQADRLDSLAATLNHVGVAAKEKLGGTATGKDTQLVGMIGTARTQAKAAGQAFREADAGATRGGRGPGRAGTAAPVPNRRWPILMASMIANLARDIREVARMSGPYQSGLREAVEACTRLASGLPAHPSSADARIAAALRTAKRHAAEAGRALDSFAREADAFAGRLADGPAAHPALGGLRAAVVVGEILAVGVVTSATGAAAPLADIAASDPVGGSQLTTVERSALHTAAAVHDALDAAKDMKGRADEISDAISVSPEQTNSLVIDPNKHGHDGR